MHPHKWKTSHGVSNDESKDESRLSNVSRWDYNWLNMTAFKGGWGVELNESDATVNNNVATYFKLSPPVQEPAKKAQRKGVLEGGQISAAAHAAVCL